MKIEKIPRSSLVSRVVESVRQVIESHQLSAGARLPSETEFVVQLGVSRAVVREAIGRMEALGLVSVQRGRGMYVGDRDSLSNCVKLVRTAMAIAPKDLTQIVEFREALEIAAVRGAAERSTPEDVAELAALQQELKRTTDQAAGIAVDYRFHRKIAEMSGNPILVQVMDVVHDYVVEAMARAASEPRNATRIAQLHRPILEAIRNRDPEAAEKAMRNHLARHARRLYGWAD